MLRQLDDRGRSRLEQTLDIERCTEHELKRTGFSLAFGRNKRRREDEEPKEPRIKDADDALRVQIMRTMLDRRDFEKIGPEVTDVVQSHAGSTPRSAHRDPTVADQQTMSTLLGSLPRCLASTMLLYHTSAATPDVLNKLVNGEHAHFLSAEQRHEKANELAKWPS